MLTNNSCLKLLIVLLVSLYIFSCENKNFVDETLNKDSIDNKDKNVVQGSISGGIHVRADANEGGDGLTWINAFNDLQKGIEKAKEEGIGKVYIAQGSYKASGCPNRDDCEDMRNRHFSLRNNVEVIGGYTAKGDEHNKDPSKTILTGDISNNISVHNVFYHPAKAGLIRTAKLKYVTITKGNAKGNNKDSGGGMYNNNSSPTLTGVSFTGNNAIWSGGGMANYNKSSPTLKDVSFTGNNADNGGGIYNNNSSLQLTNVSFTGNNADNGGGIYNNNSSLQLTNVSFTGNNADNGGGIYNNNSSLQLTNVSFTNNTVDNYGGGIYSIDSSLTLTSVKFINNMAYSFGGGIHNNGSSITLTKVEFINNTAYSFGGGIHNGGSSSSLTFKEGVSFKKNLVGRIKYKQTGKGGAIYNEYGKVRGSPSYGAKYINEKGKEIDEENKKVIKNNNKYVYTKSGREDEK